MAAAFGAGTGAVVLLGWIFDIPRLTRFVPSWLPMRPYAAVSFVFLGAALWAFTGRSPRSRVLCAAFVCVPLLIGVVTLGEWVSGRNLGLDGLPFTDVVGAGQTPHPGRIPASAALALIAVGVGVLIARRPKRQLQVAGQVLVVWAVAIASPSLLAWLLGVALPPDSSAVAPMRVNGALAITVLGIGCLSATRDFGFVRVLRSSHLVGAIVRWSLLGAVLLTLAAGSLVVRGRLGQQLGRAYGQRYGEVVLATTILAGMVGLVLIGASLVARFEAARVRAEGELDRIGEERRRLLGQLMTAQEDERARVARELHDDLGQILASLSLMAKRIEVEEPTEEQRERVRHLRARVEQAIGRMRSLVTALRPTELDALGLSPAVKRLAAQVWEDGGVRVDVVDGLGPERLSPEVEATMYRVVQEALSNVNRHADARHVSVLFSHSDGAVTAIVEDDGKGFDVSGSGTGFGLMSMRERARLVDGNLVIESSPSGGTIVRLKVPVSS